MGFISTNYRLTQFRNEHLSLVKPQTITLGRNQQGTNVTYQCVPLLDVLNFLLQCDDIFEWYCNGEK